LFSEIYNKIVENYFILTEFTKIVRNEIYHVQLATQNVAFYTFSSLVLYWDQSAGQNFCGYQALYKGRISQHFTELSQTPNVL